MPSHPERVRRNYHDVEIAGASIASEDCYEVAVRITRAEIATWTSARMMRDEYAEKIYRVLVKDLP